MSRGANRLFSDDRPSPMEGEIRLLGAILSQAVTDARPTRGEMAGGQAAMEKREARDFLYDRERLAFFCELAGADVDCLQPALLRNAHLPPAGIGEPICP